MPPPPLISLSVSHPPITGRVPGMQGMPVSVLPLRVLALPILLPWRPAHPLKIILPTGIIRLFFLSLPFHLSLINLLVFSCPPPQVLFGWSYPAFPFLPGKFRPLSALRERMTELFPLLILFGDKDVSILCTLDSANARRLPQVGITNAFVTRSPEPSERNSLQGFF